MYNIHMELYFVRHGNADSEGDGALTDLGVEQADNLAKRLKAIQFDAIITSPLKRAHQTAEIVNKFHNLTLQVDSRLREREREADTYVDFETWKNMFDFEKDASMVGGERLTSFLDRVHLAVEDMMQQYSGKRVLVVSHGGIHHAIYAYANKLPQTGSIIKEPMESCELRIFDL